MRPILAALAALPLLAVTSARADTLVDNVDGVTFDAQGQVAHFSAMVVGEDGRVVRLLAPGEAKPAKIAHRVDGQGRVALPGLIDSHLRLAEFGFAALKLDLAGTHSLRDIQLKLGAYAAAHPQQAWIVGSGWDHTTWDRPVLPEALDLDAVVAGRPVWLVSADGRYGWANSLALQAAGVTAETADPEGGKIEHLPAAPASVGAPGAEAEATASVPAPPEPSGVLTGTARALVERAIPLPTGADRDRALGRAEEILLSLGIIAVADMGMTIADWLAYRRAGDVGRLSVRVMAYADNLETAEAIGGPGPSPWLYGDRLRLNGALMRFDGELNAREAVLKAPYADAPETSGTALLDQTLVTNRLSSAAANNFQLAFEAHGDAAIDQLLDAIEALPAGGDRHWRIEYGAVLDPADAERIGKAHLAVAAVPQQVLVERLVAETRLGADRLDRAFAWKSLADAGTVLAFGSSAPSGSPAPFAAMAAAVTRAGPDGEPFGGWQPAQRLTSEAALAAYTVGGAWAGLADAKFGRLAPGQHADFILVDRDPLLATPDELRAIRVIETWVDGRKVYQAPDLPLAIPRQPDGGEQR